jgi:hypothetical protein
MRLLQRKRGEPRVLQVTTGHHVVSLCNWISERALARAKAPPPPGPVGILASTPPYDNSINPLRCHIDGPDTICKRDSQ